VGGWGWGGGCGARLGFGVALWSSVSVPGVEVWVLSFCGCMCEEGFVSCEVNSFRSPVSLG